MRKLFSNRIVVVLLVIAIAAGGVHILRSRANSQAANKTPSYVTGKVQRGNLVVSVDAQGTLKPAVERTVLTETNGTVDELLVSEGDTVREGQLIATLSNDNLADEVERLELDLINAQNRLSDLLNPAQETVRKALLEVEQAEINLESKRFDQESLRVTAPIDGTVVSLEVSEGDEISAGKLVASIQDDRSLALVVPVPQQRINAIAEGDRVTMWFYALKIKATSNYHRQGEILEISHNAYQLGGESVVDVTLSINDTTGLKAGMTGYCLFKLSTDKTITAQGTLKHLETSSVTTEVGGTVSKINFDEGDHVSKGQVLIELTNDSVDLAVKQAENQLEIAKSAYESLLKAEDDTDVRDQRLRVNQAQLALDSKLKALAGLRITSPVSGVVLSTHVNAGDKVSAYAKIAVIAETGKMSVKIAVDELDISKIKIGQEAIVTASALPNRSYIGKVVSISPSGVSSSGVATFGVTVDIDEPDGLLSGMTADVTINVETRENVLMVPAEAISKTGKRSTVTVVSPDGSLQIVDVKTGSSNGSFTEIVEGLKEGDSIVLVSVSADHGLRFMPGMGGGGAQIRPR